MPGNGRRMTGGAARRGAGVWPNGRARGLGPRDCRFESCHSEIRQNHMMAVWFCRFLLSETTDGGQVRSMTFSLLTILDMIGTVAFAISGALTGIRQRMDIFGVNVLAICTATGGGMLRDIIVGRFPAGYVPEPGLCRGGVRDGEHCLSGSAQEAGGTEDGHHGL